MGRCGDYIRRGESSGKEVMMVLLEKQGTDVVITEEVVKAAAGNYWSHLYFSGGSYWLSLLVNQANSRK